MVSFIEAWESCPMEVENGGRGTVYCFLVKKRENWAFVYEKPQRDEIPIVRFQSSCISGIELGDIECDCKQNLINSANFLSKLPEGGILFILNDDGKGLGGINKLRQKKLRQQGIPMKTILDITGTSFDARKYEFLPEAMKIMGFSTKCKVISRFPNKVKDLIRDGLDIVEALPYDYFITSGNQEYMAMKKEEFDFQFFDPIVSLCQSCT
jgi:GTP cyclohydrolase II